MYYIKFEVIASLARWPVASLMTDAHTHGDGAMVRAIGHSNGDNDVYAWALREREKGIKRLYPP